MQVKGDARQKGDTHYYCASPSTQVREKHVAMGVSPFITREKVYPMPYIEKRVLE
jgi:hypothetical protein